jgi:hypothetical protein
MGIAAEKVCKAGLESARIKRLAAGKAWSSGSSPGQCAAGKRGKRE